MDDGVWPLFGLAVMTSRLSLSYLDDDSGVQLAELAARGIHDPATMPFSVPWTDVESPELERNTLRYYWLSRAETTPDHWAINFAVRCAGAVVGMATVTAENFPVTRTAETGSWLGREYQGHGLGREIRRAALYLIFAGLDADRATTGAWHDNAASLGVTRSLGYRQDGSRVLPRRNQQDTMLDFSMTRRRWLTLNLGADVQLAGIGPVRQFLGLTR